MDGLDAILESIRPPVDYSSPKPKKKPSSAQAKTRIEDEIVSAVEKAATETQVQVG